MFDKKMYDRKMLLRKQFLACLGDGGADGLLVGGVGVFFSEGLEVAEH